MKALGRIQDDLDVTNKGYVDRKVAAKQDKLAGEDGQLIGIGGDGCAVAVDEISNLEVLAIWNGGNA